MARTVLVLGGGVGGIVAANELRRRLEPADRLIVIEREARYLFQASLLWLAVGRRRPQDVSRPTEKMLAPGIEYDAPAAVDVVSAALVSRLPGEPWKGT